MDRQSPSRRVVLVVDDDDDIATSLKDLLMATIPGIEAHTASSGPAGLELLRQNRVDLIITDFRMDGMNGLEFLEAASAIAPNTPGIMLTAYPELRMAQVALEERRISHFFRKPFDPAEVLGIVSALLGRYFSPELRAHAFRRSMDLARSSGL